jgi:integrase
MSDRPRVPSYRCHRQSKQAVVTLRDAITGRRRDVLLGRFGTAASKAEYKRVVVDWEANERRLPGSAATADLTIAELIDRYWEFVTGYYVHQDGSPTGEVQAMKYALRPVKYLHGHTAVQAFGPAAFKAVRELLIRGYLHPRFGQQQSLCRTRINAHMKRVRRMFKWAVENELASGAVLQALGAVAPLKAGRTEAKESAPVLPVARAVVAATLPILRPMLRDMVCLQLETGMRPGEMVCLRPCDLDTSGPVWLYKPPHHKTSHHGHERIVPLGPKAQEIVKRHLGLNVEEFLFSPKKLMEERSATMRANRKTRVQPSQRNRRKGRPTRCPGDHYSVHAFSHAIRNAIARHNRDKPESEQLPHWHPHQLRHLRAAELRREVGLDVARACLGHRSPVLTEHYGALDLGAATAAMAKLG